jgi:hypothetical protein
VGWPLYGWPRGREPAGRPHTWGALKLWPLLQGTQLPCFQQLVERLGTLNNKDAEERLMEHQLFQAFLLAELEAEKHKSQGVLCKVPAATLQSIRK